MRAVTTATAAAVLGVKRKALDNILGRVDTPEIPKGRQGVERRIPVSALVELFLATELSARLGTPSQQAFALAQELTRGGTVQVGPFLHVEADLAGVQAEVDAQLEVAIESVVRRRRGRPPRSASA